MTSAPARIEPAALRQRTENQLLTLVAGGRDATSDHARANAQAAWNELIDRDFDRVRMLVAAWHLRGRPDVRVELQDRDDATQHAFYRLLRMLSNFKGKAVPQYRAAMNRCVDFACAEFCRWEMKHDMRQGGSLDETPPGAEANDDRSRFDVLVAELSRHADAERGAEEQEEEEHRERRDAVERAIDALSSEKERSVLRLTRSGVKAPEIAEQLAESLDNVYQLRSRGIRRVQEQLEES